jgi:exoribonuclease R
MTELTKRYTSGDSTLIRGKIRMLPGKDAAAFVTCDRGSQERDVLIATMRDQNRSLDGDLVFVELLDDKESVDSVGEDEGEDEDDLTEEEAEHETAVEHNDQDRVDEVADILHDMAVGGGIPKDETNFKDEFCQETWKDDSVQKALWNPQVPVLRLPANTTTCTDSNLRIQLKGRVVCVIPPKESAGTQASELSPGLQAQYLAPRRTIVGTLKSVIPRNKSNERPLYLLTPTNKSLPQFLCPSSFQPSPVPDVAGNEEHGLYRAEYIYGSWGVSHNWPPCVNVKAMGKTCNVHDETLALLVENGVNHGDFESDVLKDVQEAVGSGLVADSSDLGWKPTPDMYKGRRDYRNQRIFTIDPTTAKDLDDALHITPLPNGQVEIGVHIADVSYFVRPETAVDTEATRRATTVYLVDRVIPMLPRPLCEVACSLNENVERLAFSCIWRMNLDGTLESKKENDEIWYGRTVIKSCARLDYATAQNIIDNKVANGESAEDMDKTLWPPSRRPTCGHTVDEVAADVRLMHKVAMARRRLRFMNGAVALNGVKLSFKLDTDGETPLLCAPYPIRDSNRLVEEYMLLANYLVAQRLITHAGGLAVLRHHPPPLQQGMQSVVEIAKEGKGFEIDASTSQSLQASLSRLSRECDDELVMQCVTELLMTPMKPGENIQ